MFPQTPSPLSQPPAQGNALTQNLFGTQTVHTREIDGHTYKVFLFGSEVALDHLPWLLKIAAGPVAVALDTFKSAVVDGLKNGGPAPMGTAEALNVLANAILEAGGAQRAKALCSTTYVTVFYGGKKQEFALSEHFDPCFQGRYGTLLKVLAFVLEVNYLPFLSAAPSGGLSPLSLLKERFKAALQPSSPDSTSPNKSGSSSESQAAGASTPTSSSEAGRSTTSSTRMKRSTSKTPRK